MRAGAASAEGEGKSEGEGEEGRCWRLGGFAASSNALLKLKRLKQKFFFFHALFESRDSPGARETVSVPAKVRARGETKRGCRRLPAPSYGFCVSYFVSLFLILQGLLLSCLRSVRGRFLQGDCRLRCALLTG